MSIPTLAGHDVVVRASSQALAGVKPVPCSVHAALAEGLRVARGNQVCRQTEKPLPADADDCSRTPSFLLGFTNTFLDPDFGEGDPLWIR
jgi:hypothetical protein